MILTLKIETRTYFNIIKGTAAIAAAIPVSFIRVNRSLRKQIASRTVIIG